MIRFRKPLLVAAFAVLATACQHPVTQEEFDALKTDFDSLKGKLQTHADSLEAWGTRTYNAICDIIAKNPQPAADPYDPNTLLYCDDGAGGEGNGTPPPPPDFP
jgi:hypothetical protein